MIFNFGRVSVDIHKSKLNPTWHISSLPIYFSPASSASIWLGDGACVHSWDAGQSSDWSLLWYMEDDRSGQQHRTAQGGLGSKITHLATQTCPNLLWWVFPSILGQAVQCRSICQTMVIQPIKNRIDWLSTGRLKDMSSCALCNTGYGGDMMLENRLTFHRLKHSLNLKNWNMTWQKWKWAGFDDRHK